jgi:hypothetical protein
LGGFLGGGEVGEQGARHISISFKLHRLPFPPSPGHLILSFHIRPDQVLVSFLFFPTLLIGIIENLNCQKI